MFLNNNNKNKTLILIFNKKKMKLEIIINQENLFTLKVLKTKFRIFLLNKKNKRITFQP